MSISFLWWGSNIGIHSGCCHYFEGILHFNSSFNIFSLSRYNTNLAFQQISSIVISRLNKQVSIRCLSAILKGVECHSDILHFYCSRICSHSTVILLVKLHSLRTFNLKLWVCIKYLTLCFLTRAKIAPHFFNVFVTHQLMPTSWSMSERI